MKLIFAKSRMAVPDPATTGRVLSATGRCDFSAEDGYELTLVGACVQVLHRESGRSVVLHDVVWSEPAPVPRKEKRP